MRREENTRANVFTRRAVIIGGLQAALLGGMFARLYGLQIARGENFQTKSDDNRITTKLLVPNRGLVTDRDGHSLALNVPSFEVYLTKERAQKNHLNTLRILTNVLGLGQEDVARIQEDLETTPSFVPVLVKRNLTLNQSMIIETHLPELPGAEVQEVLQRFYPHQRAFAHIVGYVGSVSRRDLENGPRRLYRMPNFKIGKQGFERIANKRLLGDPGFKRIEVNAGGRHLREITRVKPQAGENVALTLSKDLQFLAQEKLDKHRAGSIVLMNVKTGEVLACCSHPAFDPNQFVRGFSTTEWNDVRDNPDKPLNNKALKGVYAPGSTYKMIVMLAAMRAGMSIKRSVNCTGYIEVSNQRFHCWKRGGHGRVDMHDSLVNSCDIFYYEVAQKLGIEAINEIAREFGFGTKVSDDFTAMETSGLLPTRDWKQRRVGYAWNVGDSIQVSIGQGFMLASPLQLVTMTARLASGRKVKPHITKDISVGEFEKLNIEPYHLQLVQKAMNDVVNSDQGTAKGARINDSRYAFAGKTGTAQVRSISISERESGVLSGEEINYLQRDHAHFVGYGPVHDPEFAVCVVIEHGEFGSSVAAPIARSMLSAAMISSAVGRTV